jgi:hypothetical protein
MAKNSTENEINDGCNIDFSRITYTKIKSHAKGGKFVKMLDKLTKKDFQMQTPLMMTWGAADYKKEGEEVGNGKFQLSLQFPTDDYKTDEDVDLFLKTLYQFEDKIANDVYENEWLDKKSKYNNNPSFVKFLSNEILKKNKKNPDYPPSFRINLPQTKDFHFNIEIYDVNGVLLYHPTLKNEISPIELLPKMTFVKSLIESGGIWITNGKFSCTWRLIQCVVQPRKEKLTGQCKITINPNEKQKLEESKEKDEHVDDDNYVENSDVEDE